MSDPQKALAAHIGQPKGSPTHDWSRAVASDGCPVLKCRTCGHTWRPDQPAPKPCRGKGGDQ